ncbi:MAG: transporter substrate-binding domain-containing protein [Prevotella sp.]|nr:transporter substrate-binding domain-containing protein [Prevotella sp.]
MNRHRPYTKPESIGKLLTAAMLLLCLLMATTTAQAKREKTVKVVCDWDFAPYEFINSSGDPDGYNVEILEAILNSMGLKYEFVTGARNQNMDAFNNKEADLIVDYRNRFVAGRYHRSLVPLGYYNFAVAHLPDKPDITTVQQLVGAGTIVFNSSNDSIARVLFGSLADSISIAYHSPREGLYGVSTGEYSYYFWGEDPMRWKLNGLNLPNIVVNNFDMPATPIHIVGHDKHLIDEIDDIYARLQQRGEIEQIYNRWFHPEAVEATTSPKILFFIAIALVITFVVLALSILARKRLKAVVRRNEDLENMMHKALSMRNYSVIINDLHRGKLTNMHGNALPAEGVSAKDFIDFVHPDDRDKMKNRSKSKQAQKGQAQTFEMRWNSGSQNFPQWVDIEGNSFPEFDHRGRPKDIVITARDVTDEKKKEKEEMELALRFKKMFDSTLLAMSFYDKDGFLIDLNQKMRELCNIDGEEAERFFRTTNLFDMSLVKNEFEGKVEDTFHVCQHLIEPEAGIDKYLEFRIRPISRGDGTLLYYVITARDITAERSMYMELKKQDKALQKASATNTRYEKEMKELLENSNMYIWRLNLDTNIISFSRSMNHVEYTRTLQEHIDSMFEDERAAATETVRNLRHITKPFSTIHHFHYTPVSDKPAWHSTSGMPLTDSKGNVTELFGVVRDISGLMEAQERLKEETARAENSAMLKSTFLANMTHEIRTPLNAIVGFSDVLSMIDDAEQRKEIIRIIRNNCDMLMRLINDIFEASTMDIKPLEIVAQKVDFAQEFNIVTQSLAQRVQEPGVEYIVENPYTSFITTIDMGRMQQVITNFLTNAVKYTHQGHIRVGYRYQDGGIYMYCEDTGAGIPKDKQAKVFDRFVKLNDFVQGTGLGLNICKAIAERSGGRIGLESEGEGKGSMFWIWVPCSKTDATPAD